EDAEACRLADGRPDGVGDVVVFEIEEDAKASLASGLDRRGPGGSEELRADLAPGDDPVQAAEQRIGFVEARNIERHQQPAGRASGGQRGTPAGSAPGARPSAGPRSRRWRPGCRRPW